MEQSAKRSEMKARGARLTGSRMLSKKQVMEHLTRKGGDRELAEDTAQWLEELGAVDESAYAAAIARHYAAMGCLLYTSYPCGAAGCDAPRHRRLRGMPPHPGHQLPHRHLSLIHI